MAAQLAALLNEFRCSATSDAALLHEGAGTGFVAVAFEETVAALPTSCASKSS
jgi:hypothetical protein